MLTLSEIKIGDRIGGRFDVLRIFGGKGKSGMGIVYVCHNREFNEIVALKTFQQRFLASKETINNFKREALAWVNLERHPNIVRAKFLEDIDDHLFITLEYIAPDEQDRNTLTHYLKNPLPLEVVLEWGIQFCRGMEHAISRGITPHRDIKPDNIMITAEGILKITDFGLSGILDNSDQDVTEEVQPGLSFLHCSKGGVIAGTPPWMASEQFEGISNVRSDVYSFGLVLYQMVNNGKLPFIGQTIQEYYQLHKSSPISKLNSKLFPIIDRCIQKNPKDRYQTFKELRIDLEELFQTETGKNIPKFPINKEFDAWEISNQGLSFYTLGLLDEAIIEFKKALRIDSDYTLAYINLGAALIDKGQFNEAIKVLKKAKKINPNIANTHSILGNALKAKGQLDEAIKEYREALQINPNFAEAHFNLGAAFTDKEQLSEAIMEFQEAIKINPNFAEAHNNLGVLLIDKGQLDEGIMEYKEAININPNHARAHNNLGIVLKNKGQLDEAIKEYKEAIRIDPSFFGAHYNLGKVIFLKGQLSEAIMKFQEAIKINPNFAEAHNNLGIALYEKGLLNEAIKEYREALGLDPNMADTHVNLANGLYDKGLLDEAIKEYNNALRINPNYDRAHYGLGNALYNKGLLDEAVREYTKALHINPNYAPAYFNLGGVLFKKGDFNNAIKAYEDSIKTGTPKYSKLVENARKIIRELKEKSIK
ncbi:MAG: tetratricopeptide repeat protein [Promethearchaeota archaeon]